MKNIFVKTPKDYVSNLFGRIQFVLINLLMAIIALVGIKPYNTLKGVYDRGDSNEKIPHVPKEKVAQYASWATQVINQLGIKQTTDGMMDCPNISRLKAELINAKASFDGYTGASIAGTFGYRRDKDGRGHEVVQIIFDGDQLTFVEGHQGYANLRQLSPSELASCEYDVIG